MKNIAQKLPGFTLVELLVTITILSIISVVAYQNFGGAVDKALSARKSSDVSTIETSLQQYKLDKGYYPKAEAYDEDTNVWGYRDVNARQSNTIHVTLSGDAIGTVDTGASSQIVGGGKVRNNETPLVTDADSNVVGAKGVMSQDVLTKKYLTTDLYDPELGDIKVGESNSMIDYGIGRYVYAIYNKDGINARGSDYNIAFTLKKEGSTDYVTKIVGTYDENSCLDPDLCPETLIGPGFDNPGAAGSQDVNLKNGDVQDTDPASDSGYTTPKNPDQGIPYGLTEFVE